MTKLLELNHDAFAIVDDEDYERVARFKWTLDKNGYVVRKETLAHKVTRKILLHRFLANAPARMDVDHWDRNPLNNVRQNLRICTRRQNSMNRPAKKASCYKGVTYHKRDKVWMARLCGKCLGYFGQEIDAALAYDQAALAAFGEFAYLNFPNQMTREGIEPPTQHLRGACSAS